MEVTTIIVILVADLVLDLLALLLVDREALLLDDHVGDGEGHVEALLPRLLVALLHRLVMALLLGDGLALLARHFEALPGITLVPAVALLVADVLGEAGALLLHDGGAGLVEHGGAGALHRGGAHLLGVLGALLLDLGAGHGDGDVLAGGEGLVPALLLQHHLAEENRITVEIMVEQEGRAVKLNGKC